jgi:uncharacterized protein (DUF2384 family)
MKPKPPPPTQNTYQRIMAYLDQQRRNWTARVPPRLRNTPRAETENTYDRVMDRLEERAQVEQKLACVFVFESEARKWLHTPHRELGNRTPLQAINAGDAAKVFAIVDRMKA